MKCRLLRDMERACETPEEHAAFRATGTFPIVPAGTLIDHPQAHHQVRLGNAEPADAECEPYRLAPERLLAAQAAGDAVRAGIHPYDLEAFYAGRMTGYDAHGRGAGSEFSRRPERLRGRCDRRGRVSGLKAEATGI